MTYDKAVDLCEKALVQAIDSGGNVHLYMAGYVDALFDSGQITEENRDVLYQSYAERNDIQNHP